MEKKELLDKFIAIYRRVYKTDKNPNLMDFAKLLSIMAEPVRVSYNAEAELGKEVCEVIKRCTKVLKREVKVEITKFANEINFCGLM